MSEAKDWAGELISGQTGTGRILVSDEKCLLYRTISLLHLHSIHHTLSFTFLQIIYQTLTEL